MAHLTAKQIRQFSRFTRASFFDGAIVMIGDRMRRIDWDYVRRLYCRVHGYKADQDGRIYRIISGEKEIVAQDWADFWWPMRGRMYRVRDWYRTQINLNKNHPIDR